MSEFLDILGLVKSYFFQVFLEKKNKKNREFFFVVLRTTQRIRRFASLQDSLLTLTWHLVPNTSYGDGEVEMGLDSQKGDIKVHHVPTSLNMTDILPD